jgi:hypothetical protein
VEAALTVEDAVKRLLAEAERHREAGRWDVGHEWQQRADELSRLVSLAKSLPKRS